MPLIVCHGCVKSIKRKGLYPHLQHSGNLLCQAYLDELTFGGPPTVLPNSLHTDHNQPTSPTATLSPPSTSLNEPSNLLESISSFGDDFTPEDVEMGDVEVFLPDVEDPEDDDDTLIESLLAEEE